MMQKIEDCPVCEKPLEDAGVVMVCHECEVIVDPATGELNRLPQKKSIIKNIMGKIKSILF